MTLEKILVKFIYPNGELVEVEATIGLSILEVARQHKVPIEAACGGALSCATCHVIVDDDSYPKLPPATEDEENMLDLACGLTKTSRLCCQIIVDKSMAGAIFKVPSEVSNAMFD